RLYFFDPNLSLQLGQTLRDGERPRRRIEVSPPQSKQLTLTAPGINCHDVNGLQAVLRRFGQKLPDLSRSKDMDLLCRPLRLRYAIGRISGDYPHPDSRFERRTERR